MPCAILFALSAGCVPVSHGQESTLQAVALTPVRQRQREANARKAYSTFDSAGVTSISCEGAVDWDTLFRRQTSSSFREQVLPVLRGTRFLVTLERDGTVGVSTRATVAPGSQEAADRAESSIQNFGGVIVTALQGWARFAIAADLPAVTESQQLDKAGDHYLVAFKNGPADVAVTMDRSFLMSEGMTSEARIDTADGSILTRSHLTAMQGRYLVTSWNVVFPDGKGRDLSVDARYMQVEGVEVPAKMTLHSSLPSFGEITLPLLLTNYQLRR